MGGSGQELMGVGVRWGECGRISTAVTRRESRGVAGVRRAKVPRRPGRPRPRLRRRRDAIGAAEGGEVARAALLVDPDAAGGGERRKDRPEDGGARPQPAGERAGAAGGPWTQPRERGQHRVRGWRRRRVGRGVGQRGRGGAHDGASVLRGGGASTRRRCEVAAAAAADRGRESFRPVGALPAAEGDFVGIRGNCRGHTQPWPSHSRKGLP